MCIVDIVKFFENWNSGEEYVDSGEFIFTHEDELELFSLNLANSLIGSFRETIEIENILKDILVVRLNGSNFDCSLMKSQVGTPEYYWRVDYLN